MRVTLCTPPVLHVFPAESIGGAVGEGGGYSSAMGDRALVTQFSSFLESPMRDVIRLGTSRVRVMTVRQDRYRAITADAPKKGCEAENWDSAHVRIFRWNAKKH
ncbi:hypothetical protein CEXT_277021 [Caerostris extrusa]|uniref:Uncharacterized protein n=1 Tax=Caerostris extrusa TaxID=172846 RepID=A0AAV4XW67_CAEEX|nr:hypothetical protein CEXT_277021 [Caerostris extrusa]